MSSALSTICFILSSSRWRRRLRPIRYDVSAAVPLTAGIGDQLLKFAPRGRPFGQFEDLVGRCGMFEISEASARGGAILIDGVAAVQRFSERRVVILRPVAPVVKAFARKRFLQSGTPHGGRIMVQLHELELPAARI